MIGSDTDQRMLILAPRKNAKEGSYVLVVDEELFGHIQEAQAPEEPAPTYRPARTGVGSALTPREIQMRLRSGRSVEEVAVEAGVEPEWVERFAAPVRAEQAAAVARAGRSVLHSPRKGPSERTLESSVVRNLADRGVVMLDDEWANAWGARHGVDSDWLISLTFRSRGRTLVAEWLFDSATGSLTSRNRLGAELGFVDAGRPAPGTAVESGADPVLPGRRPRSPGRARRTSGSTTAKSVRSARPAARSATTKPAPATTKKVATTKKAATATRASAKKPTANKGAPAKKVASAKKVVSAKKAAANPAVRSEVKKATAARAGASAGRSAKTTATSPPGSAAKVSKSTVSSARLARPASSDRSATSGTRASTSEPPAAGRVTLDGGSARSGPEPTSSLTPGPVALTMMAGPPPAMVARPPLPPAKANQAPGPVPAAAASEPRPPSFTPTGWTRPDPAAVLAPGARPLNPTTGTDGVAIALGPVPASSNGHIVASTNGREESHPGAASVAAAADPAPIDLRDPERLPFESRPPAGGGPGISGSTLQVSSPPPRIRRPDRPLRAVRLFIDGDGDGEGAGPDEDY